MICIKTSSYTANLLLFLTTLTTANDTYDVESTFKEYDIIPDVITKAPKEFLKITYEESCVVVDKGNILTPTQVREQPKIEWTAEPNTFYTISFLDPDAPIAIDPTFREFKHWLVGNIPGNDIDSGDVLTAFIGSGPPKDTGLHRYVFLLFKQLGKIKFDETFISNRTSKGRPNFKISDFARKYNLDDPIAGNFYLAEYDDYVPILQQQLSEE